MEKIDSTLHLIREFLVSTSNVHTSAKCDEDTTCIRSRLQFFFDKKFSNRATDLVYQTFLTHVAQAEKTSAGAGSELIRMAERGDSKATIHSQQKSVCTLSNVRDKARLLGLRTHDVELFVTACLLSSIETKISIKKSRTLRAFIEKNDGHNFSLSPMLKVPREIVSPKIAIIDGYIENVSEIHHFLEDASTKKQPCILFVRGMADDVLNTIKVNNDRGTFQIYPVRVPFDVDNANALVDIAVVCGADVTSSLKGDLISSINYGTLPDVDYVHASNQAVLIRNSKTKKRVQEHTDYIRDLIEKRPELEELLSRRLKSLTSSHIILHIPDDFSFQSTSQKFDELIRWLSHKMNRRQSADETAALHYEAWMSTVRSLSTAI